MILALLNDSRPLFYQQSIQVPADTSNGSQFGGSSSLDGDGVWLAVGAPFGQTAGATTGRAYVQKRTGSSWSMPISLTPPVASTDVQYGFSVAISKDGLTCVVGTPRRSFPLESKLNAGSAYVFTRTGDTWSLQTDLTASDRETGDQFGWSVALSDDGNTCAIGAYADDVTAGPVDAGGIYVFTRSAGVWTQATKQTAASPEANANLGYSIALSGDGTTVATGAWQQDNSATDAGAVHVFTRTGADWTVVDSQVLLPSDPEVSDKFGVSVSLTTDGNLCLVGAAADDTLPYVNSGSAYVFSRSGLTWTQQAKLASGTPASNESFGTAVSMSSDGRICAVGAPGAMVNSIANAGAFYVFTRVGTVWTQVSRQTASDRAANNMFGTSVTLSANGRLAASGAVNGNTTAGNAGKVYTFLW